MQPIKSIVLGGSKVNEISDNPRQQAQAQIVDGERMDQQASPCSEEEKEGLQRGGRKKLRLSEIKS